MRHIHLISNQRPARAATLLTKAQAINNARGIVLVGQEALIFVQLFLDIFAKGE